MSERRLQRPAIIYPDTEIMGNDLRSGNFIRPDNFRIPDFCEGCPLAGHLKEPQISRVSGLYPVSGVSEGVIHVGEFQDYVADVLVLYDASDKEADAVYLGDLPIPAPFSVEHERPDSRALGYAHRAVDRCKEPAEQTKGIFRKRSEIVCLSGLVRVKDFREQGFRLKVDSDQLRKGSVVVGKNTQKEIDRMCRSALAREKAGRPMRDLASSEEYGKVLGLLLSMMDDE